VTSTGAASSNPPQVGHRGTITMPSAVGGRGTDSEAIQNGLGIAPPARGLSAEALLVRPAEGGQSPRGKREQLTVARLRVDGRAGTARSHTKGSRLSRSSGSFMTKRLPRSIGHIRAEPDQLGLVESREPAAPAGRCALRPKGRAGVHRLPIGYLQRGSRDHFPCKFARCLLICNQRVVHTTLRF
jgi:hypothetical protein